MKCPNCGNECKNNTCNICGSTVLPSNIDTKIKLYSAYAEIIYTINCILFPPAKIVAIWWSLYTFASLFPTDTVTFIQKLIILLFGYLFFCGIADIIYASNKQRYHTYKIRILKKKIERLEKILHKYQTSLDEVPHQANAPTANPNQPQPFSKNHNYSVNLQNLEPLFADAGRAIIDRNKSSISTLQRIFKIGFNQASRLMDQLCEYGVVGEEIGTTPRRVLMSNQQFEELLIELKTGYSFSDQDESSVYSSPNYDNMEGHDFEYFCADLLRKNGFINVEVTQGSGDHGIDVLAEKDDITYAIQCKCYSSNIGNAAVQQAHTGKSLYHRDVAVVMTNQYFTQQAKEEAAALRVKLWDRDKLNELIEKSML